MRLHQILCIGVVYNLDRNISHYKENPAGYCHKYNNNNNNNDNNNNIYLLQLGCHPVAVVVLRVNKT